MSEPNELLLESFRAHGVEAVVADGWVTFPGRPVRAIASIENDENLHRLSVRLDICLEVEPGRAIVESFAGVGETPEKAALNAFENFVANSLHVLLSAFFLPGDEHVSRDEWVVGGRKGHVLLGDVGARGRVPPLSGQLDDWRSRLKLSLSDMQLRPGWHWVRVYFAQANRDILASEVLLDNLVWEEGQAALSTVKWPLSDDFYSIRVFLVIQIEKGGVVSAETAVEWLADMVAFREEFTQEEVQEQMDEAGIPKVLAQDAYEFTQVAWARGLLHKIGVTTHPDYLRFNASGDLLESGRLAEHPCFAAASRLVEKYEGSPGFRHLVLTSSEVNAVNSALHNGANPHDLRTSPVACFSEPPTSEGMKRVQARMAGR